MSHSALKCVSDRVLYPWFGCHTFVRPSSSSGTSEAMFLFVLHSLRSCRSLIPGQYWPLTHPRSLLERIKMCFSILERCWQYKVIIYWVVLSGSLADLNTLQFLFLCSFLYELQQVLTVHLQTAWWVNYTEHDRILKSFCLRSDLEYLLRIGGVTEHTGQCGELQRELQSDEQTWVLTDGWFLIGTDPVMSLPLWWSGMFAVPNPAVPRRQMRGGRTLDWI